MSTSPWILTAFEPFGSRTHNASAMILDAVSDARIHTHMLPVVFHELAAHITALLDRRPQVFVLMGETGQQRNVRVERVALNILDSRRRPDNGGVQVDERPITPGGPLALSATWNADRVVQVMRSHRVPAVKSYHAGSYACNQALYLALSHAQARASTAAIGFLHVPGRAQPLQQRCAAIAAAVPAMFEALAQTRTEVVPEESP